MYMLGDDFYANQIYSSLLTEKLCNMLTRLQSNGNHRDQREPIVCPCQSEAISYTFNIKSQQNCYDLNDMLIWHLVLVHLFFFMYCYIVI